MITCRWALSLLKEILKDGQWEKSKPEGHHEECDRRPMKIRVTKAIHHVKNGAAAGIDPTSGASLKGSSKGIRRHKIDEKPGMEFKQQRIPI